MLTPVVQRWRGHRASYRPAREVIDTTRLEVAPIPDDRTARAFVELHHYEGTYPAARFRFGLFERAALVGVVVFSVPVRPEVTGCLPGAREAHAELGRLVLLDRVAANAESWFIARCFEELRREGLVGVVSFSDPMRRTALDGSVTMPGHVGIVYQATNGLYLGRSRADTLRLLPDGSTFANRAAAKIRARDRGWRYAVERLVAHGAAPLGDEDPRAWLARELPRVTRRIAHPGKHKYAWTLRGRDRRHLERWLRTTRGVESLPYPKMRVGVTPAMDETVRGASAHG